MQDLEQAKQNQTTTNEAECLWLDDRGFPFSDAELKSISPAWNAEMWERYLKWYESPLAESQIRLVSARETRESFDIYHSAQTKTR